MGAKHKNESQEFNLLQKVARALSKHGFTVEEPSPGDDVLDIWQTKAKHKGYHEITMHATCTLANTDIQYCVFTWSSGYAGKTKDHDVEIQYNPHDGIVDGLSELVAHLNQSFE